MSKEFIHNPDIIGKNLKLLRISKDFALTKSAQKAGISSSFLSLVEQGKRTIKFLDLHALLKVYGTSITRFISMICDTIEDYPYAPNELVQTKRQALLLDGSSRPNSYYLMLHRPLRNAQDIALLTMFLPAETASWDPFLSFDGEMRGIVVQGLLLLEFPQTEQVIRCGEEFCIPENTACRFRNHTDENTDIVLLSKPGNP